MHCRIIVFQEVIPDWQMAASSVLVAISSKYCNDVMTELLEKFQPGVLPHFFVVQTLANMATVNGKLSKSDFRGYYHFIRNCLLFITGAA
jgi:hypothetical protein